MLMKNCKTILLTLSLAGVLTGTAIASPAIDLAKQLNQAFIEVAEKVSPSVVVITVTQRSAIPNLDGLDGSPWDMLPREFRRRFRSQLEETPQPKEHGQGSGIILTKDGYILTNRHVVENAEKIEVRLKDGRRFAATVRGADPQSDVAVVKIDAKNLPAAKFADSTATRVGEFAIAIGAPFALDYSVTFGHVSAKGRSGVIYDPTMDQDFIQTDANINPGNSGGPLVNIDGQVIGINTLIRGQNTGIGFAIPGNLAKEVAAKLMADGKFTRAWLGIGIRGLREDAVFGDIIKGVDDGIIVQSILPDGPAAKSDLKPADVITAVDGKAISTVQQFRNEIRIKPIGVPVSLDVFRQGKKIKVSVKPGTWAENETAATTTPTAAPDETTNSLGLTVQALTHELADQFLATMTPGVIVTAVERGGLAARSRIKPGDIITEVNQSPVTNPREFRAALKTADPKKGIILNLVSDKTSRFEILKDGEE